MRAFRRYLFSILGGSVVLLGAVALVNLRVNPLRVSPGFMADAGLEEYRDYSTLPRTGKCGYIRSGWDIGVALVGSSRVATGMDPEHPSWGRGDVINLGCSAALLYETTAFCRYLLDRGEPETIILGIDLGDLSSEIDSRPLLDFHLSPLNEGSDALNREARYLVGIGTLKASLSTLSFRREGRLPEYTVRGQRRRFENPIPAGQLHFLAEELRRGALQGMISPASQEEALVIHAGKARLLQETMDRCRARGVRLVCLINPTHALLFTDSTMGPDQEPPYLGERRALVELAEAANALDSTGPPVEVWDFASYHPVTCEEVALDGSRPLRWWLDFSHFREEVGTMVLARLMDWEGHEAPEREFGRKLTSANFDDWTASLREDLRAWVSGPGKDDLQWKSHIVRMPAASLFPEPEDVASAPR